MNHIDILGDRPERRRAFSRELLSETTDEELQRLVARAAEELSTPMALVTMVLDQIQYFKAHAGLPPDLKASRALPRDVSFCQFVVRDQLPFEVNDARRDSRIPQAIVHQYNIQAYLGMPIRSRGTIIGALCVLDTKPRTFTQEEYDTLAALASSVDERLEVLTTSRQRARTAVTIEATSSMLVQLSETLASVRSSVEQSLPAIVTIRSTLDLASFLLDDDTRFHASALTSIDTARRTLNAIDDALHEANFDLGNSGDYLRGLQRLTTTSTAASILDVLSAAQDLARSDTDAIGGVALPHLESDPELLVPAALAVALVTRALKSLARALTSKRDARSKGRLSMALRHIEDALSVTLDVEAHGLERDALTQIIAPLSEALIEEEAIQIEAIERGLRLTFATR